MSFTIGENVGPYRIIEQLGQGGMATVFKAYHPALDRYVAIKVLHPAFKEDETFHSRFQREARVVARLEHPNIVPVYDYSEHKGQPYLVMKYIEGITLKARLGQHPLTKEEALGVVDAVGSGLAYAHEKGVLHRDIKPSNVLLSQDGSLYLADFGLARIAQAGASTLSQDMLLGTPQYISPEQARGARDLDEGTDIYSFGVLLYELVVGRVPFNADTPFSIIHDHIYTPLPMPRSINENVPESVERVLLKALAKARPDRFESVTELMIAFRAAVLGQDPGIMFEEAAVAVVPLPSTQTQVDPSSAFGEADEGLGESPPESGVPMKSRSRWLWVGGGLVMTSLCLIAFLSAVGNSEQIEPIPTQKPPADVIGVDLPENVRDDLPEEGTPEFHYRKAEALLSNNRAALAAQEFIKAAEIFLDHEAYPEAAETYFRALEVSTLTVERNRRLEDDFSRALYFGSPDERVWPIIEALKESYPEWGLVQVLEARALLHAGESDQAGSILERLVHEDESPFAIAVLVEYHLLRDEVDEAGAIFEEIHQAPDAFPPWLFEHLMGLQEEFGG